TSGVVRADHGRLTFHTTGEVPSSGGAAMNTNSTQNSLAGPGSRYVSRLTLQEATMAAIRRAEVVWEGDLAKGAGKVTAKSSGMFKDQPVTWASRSEEPNGKTSPEELLAAAHASCFSMALSAGLAKAGTPPQRLDVSATVTFDKAGEGFEVKSSA